MGTSAIRFCFVKTFLEKHSYPKGTCRWFTMVTTFVRVSLDSESLAPWSATGLTAHWQATVMLLYSVLELSLF